MTLATPLAADFRAEWALHHRTLLPIGWLLRQERNLAWVRFHALPNSKRYAENDQDRSIILSRANTLGDRLLGLGNLCWFIEARMDKSEGSGELAMEAAEDDDPESTVWRFFVRSEAWEPGKYDGKLLSIADDESSRAVWMRRDNGSVFAPYDGGFDLFPSTWHEVDGLKSAGRDWLSNHPEGL